VSASRGAARQNTADRSHRAPRDTQDDDPQRALYRSLDYFPTAPWAGRAVGHWISQLDPAAVIVDEPACGEGHLAHGLKDYFQVRCSDIHPFGYGAVRDFFAPYPADLTPPDWIITNPPFAPAANFLRLALSRARRGVALVQRLGFVESIGRHDLLFGPGGLTFKVVFSERVPMVLGRWHPGDSSPAAYALYVVAKRPLADRWPDAPLLRAFPPGTRDAMTRPSDMAFARAAA